MPKPQLQYPPKKVQETTLDRTSKPHHQVYRTKMNINPSFSTSLRQIDLKQLRLMHIYKECSNFHLPVQLNT